MTRTTPLEWMKRKRDEFRVSIELHEQLETDLFEIITKVSVYTEQMRIHLKTARQSRARLVGLVRERAARGWITSAGVKWVKENASPDEAWDKAIEQAVLLVIARKYQTVDVIQQEIENRIYDELSDEIAALHIKGLHVHHDNDPEDEPINSAA